MARAELPGADEVLAIELLGGFVGLIGLVAIGQLSTLVPLPGGDRRRELAVVATGLVYGGVVLISQAVPWLFVETRDLRLTSPGCRRGWWWSTSPWCRR
ncbi:MAG: hypothetical protein HS111_17665 [Kofleriaceae bacterium]|nr:hypothetical protein [Kofleriaceae bacterium]